MAEEKNTGSGFAFEPPSARSGNKGMVVVIVIAVLVVLGFSAVVLDTRHRVSSLEQKQAEFLQKADQSFADMESRVKASADAVAAQVGSAQQELAQKAVELQKSQRAAVNRLSKQQQKAIEEVSTEVSGVKTDVDATKTEVASTKTDVANTKNDLEATKTKLEKTIGDLGVQSGLIAHTRDELVALKRRGERNYYEFTLKRGQSPIAVSNVNLQLRKVDPKRNRFTMNVMADDKIIEKRDRNLAEPLQFYTGRDHQLYEVVVFTVAKNEVSGYLSTPKEAPQPMSQ